MLWRLIRTFAVPLSKWPKGPSHKVAETTMYHGGIRSVTIFIAPSGKPPMGKNLAVLSQHCCPILTSEGTKVGMKPFILLASHTPAIKHGILRMGWQVGRAHLLQMSTNSISSQVMRNGIFPVIDLESAWLMALEVSDLWRALTPDSHSFSSDFTIEELMSALQHLKPGKAPGPDSIYPHLILHAGTEMKSWLCESLYSCLLNLKIPKIWREH